MVPTILIPRRITSDLLGICWDYPPIVVVHPIVHLGVAMVAAYFHLGWAPHILLAHLCLPHPTCSSKTLLLAFHTHHYITGHISMALRRQVIQAHGSLDRPIVIILINTVRHSLDSKLFVILLS